MGVVLSAAASLAWWAGRGRGEAELLAEVDDAACAAALRLRALSRRRADAAQRRAVRAGFFGLDAADARAT
jgi:hypothetical protein